MEYAYGNSILVFKSINHVLATLFFLYPDQDWMHLACNLLVIALGQRTLVGVILYNFVWVLVREIHLTYMDNQIVVHNLAGYMQTYIPLECQSKCHNVESTCLLTIYNVP